MTSRWTDQDVADYKSRMQKRTTKPKVGVIRGEAPTIIPVSAPSKYRNTKTTIEGQTFDSKKEANRWLILRDKERTGEIRNLTRQVRMPLEVDGFRICVYVCDFRYEARSRVRAFPLPVEWQTIYEDTKGVRTPVYLLKKKLVKGLLKIDILET